MGELSLPKYEGTGAVLYSAVFGGYDRVFKASSCDSIDSFILFTDDEDLVVEGWEVIYVLATNLSSKALNRMYKLRPHIYIPNASSTIYIDGNVGFEGNAFEPLISYFEKNILESLRNVRLKLGRSSMEDVGQKTKCQECWKSSF